MNFVDEVLFLSKKASAVYCVTTDKSLRKSKDGGFELPDVKGRLLLEVKDFFN